MRAARKQQPKATLVGLGFDAEDGHKRLTRGENFVLAGGSEETHAVMQETAVKVNEHLDCRGRRMACGGRFWLFCPLRPKMRAVTPHFFGPASETRHHLGRYYQ